MPFLQKEEFLVSFPQSYLYFALIIFFTEPYYTFVAFSSNYPITFLIMLAAGLITSTLIKRIQEQVRVSAEKSYRTEVLLQTNKDLAQVDSVVEILEATVQQLKKIT